MEVERSSSRSVKRKPLSDRTNLIPTTTLRTLYSSSSPLSVKPPNPKPNPNSKSKQKSEKPNPKPYNSSTKSDTSVGSSNNDAPNPINILQKQPSTLHSVPSPNSSSTSRPGNGNGETLESLVLYGRGQTGEKTKDNNGREVSVPSSCRPLGKTKVKGEAVAVDFSFPPLEKTKGKGKVATVPFGRPSVESPKNKGKVVTVPLSCRPPEKRNDEGKEVTMPFDCPLMETTRNKGKAVAMDSSCPPLLRTRAIRDKLNSAEDIGISKSFTALPKQKKKRRCSLAEQDVSRHALPLDFIEQQRAYFKEVDEFELPEEEVTYDKLDE